MTQDSDRPYVHGYGAASQHMATRQAEQFADFLLPHLNGSQKLLDVGCGPGTITVGLASEVRDTLGIDIAQSEVDKANVNAQLAGVSNIEFRQGDATALDLPSESFDLVYSCAALEHVPDKEKAVDEFLRVLKPGGIIALVGGVFQGHLIGPEIPEAARIWEIFNGMLDNTNMDRDFELRQRPMLRSRGISDLQQWPWYYDSSDGVGYGQRFRSEEFIEQVENLGISNRDEMIQIAAVINNKRKSPDHYTYLAWMKTLGTKPS